MVPDVSGIDKVFDYIVPEAMRSRVSLGVRVRIPLNGRRVGGWVVAYGEAGTVGDTSLAPERLAEIASVSGYGVQPDIVPLTRWLADHFFGSWRASLSRASAPRVRPRHVYKNLGTHVSLTSPVADAAQSLFEMGGGLCVVPPNASALHVVNTLALHGSVLVVCPTQRMAVLGAASLRRQGLTTAVVPDEWDSALAGVNVVIGARSAVFAPCHDLAAVVVIDEHDELHHDERAPTWNAVDVGRERARLAGVPFIATSACPSPESLVRHSEHMCVVAEGPQWPAIVVQNLDDVPVAGSLLSSALLDAVKDVSTVSVCVLNTKGKARLIVCKSCGVSQKCSTCGSLLSQDDQGTLTCHRCAETKGAVCVSCGRTSFSVPRGGVSHLISQLRKTSSRPIIEITADSDDTWSVGSMYVGTEAVLYRTPSASTVVFADIDRDLFAPRITAVREVLALIMRAARIVGGGGRVIIQTRSPEHPLFQALTNSDTSAALMQWNLDDLASRRMFSLPPFSEMAHVALSGDDVIPEVLESVGVRFAVVADGLLLSAETREQLAHCISEYRARYGASLRVHADPTRY